MTWKQLSEAILAMPEDKQNTDVTVLELESEECVPASTFVNDWKEMEATTHDELSADEIAKSVWFVDGVLDEGHPYLIA